MKYLVFLLAVGLAAGNGQPWPMGEQCTRETIMYMPRPAPSKPPSQVFLDHTPWEGVKLPAAHQVLLMNPRLHGWIKRRKGYDGKRCGLLSNLWSEMPS